MIDSIEYPIRPNVPRCPYTRNTRRKPTNFLNPTFLRLSLHLRFKLWLATVCLYLDSPIVYALFLHLTIYSTTRQEIVHTLLVMCIWSHLSCSFLLVALSFSSAVSSASTLYKRKLSIVGPDFFEQFNWEIRDDPTHGRVNYLSLEEARAANLAYGS